MTHCFNCGSKLKKMANFCSSCGNPLRDSRTEKASLKRKRPWVAAVLNFLIPGVGYLYNGSRVVFGTLVLFTSFIATYVFFTIPNAHTPIELVGGLVLGGAFAYDAYEEAEEITRE